MALSEEQKLKRIAEAQRTLGKASSSRHQPAIFDYAPTPQSTPRSLESLYANPSIDVYAFAPVGGLGSEPGSAPQEDQDGERERLDREADELLSQVSRVSTQAETATEPEQAVSQQDSHEVQPEQIEGVIDRDLGRAPGVANYSSSTRGVLPESMGQPVDASTFTPPSAPDTSQPVAFGPSDVPMANQAAESPVTLGSLASVTEAPSASSSNRTQPRRASSPVWPPAAPGVQDSDSPIRGVSEPPTDWNSGQSMMGTRISQRPVGGDLDTGSLEESGAHLLDSMTDLIGKLASLTINAQQRLDDIEQSLEGIYDLDEFEGG